MSDGGHIGYSDLSNSAGHGSSVQSADGSFALTYIWFLYHPSEPTAPVATRRMHASLQMSADTMSLSGNYALMWTLPNGAAPAMPGGLPPPGTGTVTGTRIQVPR